MSAKHTPGPWSINFSKLNGNVIHWHVTDKKSGSTNSVAMADEEMGKPRSSEELKANAHLIAAAPEMLEALQAVVRVADRASIEFDFARAAIAKATGES